MSLASAMFLAQPQAHAAVAPLNPDYVEYMERQTADGRPAARSLAANSSEQQQNHPVGGYIPSPLNWSHLDGKTWSLPQNVAAQSGGTALARAAANSSEALPSKYNLRERGEITPVRDQTAFNNCWTYSAMAATESNLLKKGLADAAALDLSEWYLTYYALNPYGGMPGFTRLQPGLHARGRGARLQARERALPRRFRPRERTVGSPALGRPPRHDKARDNAVRRGLSRHTYGRYEQQQLQ